MQVAALYDIHGNLPALEAVLAEIKKEGTEQIVVGGDVFPGPMASECLERLLALRTPTHFIRGNGERELLATAHGDEPKALPDPVREVLRWNAAQLSAKHRQVLERWPKTLRFTIPSAGDILFCHATPRDDNEIFTRLTPEEKLAPIFAGLNVSAVVCGHTHMQFERETGRVNVVNAGSVGMPFGATGAFWLAVGAAGTLELRRTGYDLERAAEHIRKTDYPHAADFAARYVLDAPSEAKTLEVLTKAELK